ncbi:MAG: PVC-type heme-binding CxxCH protein, partial [Opitutales bacterium]
PYLDLLGLVNPDVPKAKKLTMNSLQLNDTGHRRLAELFLEKLGLPARKDLDYQKGSRIRKVIQYKNELYFYSWRPQNQTYIYSFRKREQGRHAKDIPGFAPLVAKKETAIRSLLESLPEKIKRAPDPPPFLWESINPSDKALQDANSFQVPDDLKLNLFASEPAIKNPTQSAWDEYGRLWIATAESYPHIAPGFIVNDKIIVLEDIDRDGVADRRRVFADGLLMPTAILPGHGGVYVGTSTEILHLRDTDGDGRADEKTILISGLGTEDTHHVVHSLRHTEDGKVGFNQSIYINTHVETPWGVHRLRKSGVWAFDPNTHDLEIFAYGLVNPWGHQTDGFGQSFLTDGAGGAGIHYAFPGAAYTTSAYHARNEVLPGLNPGQPKQCGLEIITSSIFPEKYRGLLVTNDFRGHRTLSFRLSDNRSGFFSAQQQDLIHVASKGTDRHGAAGMYRPVDVDEGPDGALYINDWSNHIIQHGEVDFHDKRRDHQHGRIWRLMPKGAKALPYGELAKQKPSDWMEALSSPETFVRRTARRLLVEKGGVAIAPKLFAEARKKKDD